MSALASCTQSSVTLPVIDGLVFQPLEVNLISGYSTSLPGPGIWTGEDTLHVENLTFCNVSLTYNHEGHMEPVNTQVYLPFEHNWNGRMVGVGGGGWAAGLMDVPKAEMVGRVSQGYFAVGTNGGGDPYNPSPENWLLHDNGTVNMYLLETFHIRALGDAANIGKTVTQSFYDTAPKYSYWQGCSQGGRQGFQLAQRYPQAYDGILAAAPALNVPSFLTANLHLSVLMNEMGTFPHKCEFGALRDAAIAECDYEDGLSDGIISNPSACLDLFDPYDHVGTTVPCSTTEGTRDISMAAAKVAEAAWTGSKMHNGTLMWYATSPDADLTDRLGQARTKCKGQTCYASDPSILSIAFLKYMVQLDIDFTKITQLGLERIFQLAKDQYDHYIATNDPDLSGFRHVGGKILSFHGLADEIIPPGGTRNYYETVLGTDPDAEDYFRYFEAPGLAHCFGGRGPYTTQSFSDLVAWVEQGKAPDILLARGASNREGRVMQRPLCAYPLVARYKGAGDPDDPSSFYCAENHSSTTPMKLMLQRLKRLFTTKTKVDGEL